MSGKDISWKSDREHKFKVKNFGDVEKESPLIEYQDLKAGSRLLFQVLNVYNVSQFDGEKAIVLSTTSWLGGKNSFLGWAYIVVAILCILLAAGFAIKAKVSPRPLGDMAYFQW